MRLGLMGGTFNPIHYGHLASADEVCEAFTLDSVVLVPASTPPHKELTEIIAPQHRLMMTTLAAIMHPRLVVSSIEIDRPGASYTVDTIAQFKQQYEELSAIYFIVGIDAFVEIASWRHPDALLGSCHTIVVSRPGYNLHELALNTLQKMSQLYSHCTFEPLTWKQPLDNSGFQVCGTPYQIYLHQVTGLDISSTEIRQRVRTKRSIRYLLPDSVDAYIRKYHLYS